jgi:hypothetical protein
VQDGSTHADAGAPVVDPTLVDLLLSLSPDERLRWNDRMARTVLELRDAFAASDRDRDSDPELDRGRGRDRRPEHRPAAGTCHRPARRRFAPPCR